MNDSDIEEEGICYLLQLSTGVIKIGRTIHIAERFRVHKTEAKRLGIHFDKILITDWHGTFISNEKKALKAMKAASTSVIGEYFCGVGIDTAVNIFCDLNSGVNEIISINDLIKAHKPHKKDKGKFITVRVTQEQYKRLCGMSEIQDLPVSTLIRQAIAKHIFNKPYQ